MVWICREKVNSSHIRVGKSNSDLSWGYGEGWTVDGYWEYHSRYLDLGFFAIILRYETFNLEVNSSKGVRSALYTLCVSNYVEFLFD